MAFNIKWGVFILAIFGLVISLAFVQAQIPNPGHSGDQIANLENFGSTSEFCTKFNSNPDLSVDQLLGCGCTAGPLFSPVLFGPPAEEGYIAKFVTSSTYDSSEIFQNTSGTYNKVRIGDGPNIHALTVFGGARFDSVVSEGVVRSVGSINMFNSGASVRAGEKIGASSIEAGDVGFDPCNPDGGGHGTICAENDVVAGGTLYVEGVGDLSDCEVCFPDLKIAVSGPNITCIRSPSRNLHTSIIHTRCMRC